MVSLALLVLFVYVLIVAQKLKLKKNESAFSRILRAILHISKQSGLNNIIRLDIFLNNLQKTISRMTKTASQKRRMNSIMSVDEAHAVLGLKQDCSRDDVKKAFRKLMLINHPDTGGTKYLADKIITAKERLLLCKKK